MPAVFVHGVPDTPLVWDPILAELDRDDVVALQLPGFGCLRPDGFAATKEAYVEWLVAELAAIEGPIDLVGHDWGSLLTQRVASLRVPRLRSWAAGNGPVDRTYVWHDMAQLWQTPEVGEQIMRDAVSPEALRPMFESEGFTPEAAAAEAAAVDDTMKACILELYRSAVDVGAEWADDLDRIEAPGLVLWATDDPFVGFELGERLAARTGARLVPLDSTHWWPTQRPVEAAAALTTFWAEVG